MNAYVRLFFVFWGLGLIAFAAEYLFPARNVPYRAVFFRDLMALGAYNLCFLLVLPISDHIPIPNYVPTSVTKLPLAYKLGLFYIVEDFGLYWVHRLMHTNRFWRTHKWHHYPNYMYWLAGVRASIPHIFLFNVTFIVARPLLSGAPLWLFQLIAFEHILRNHWMHMNVTWNSQWLEYFVVTPRYHQIHHSNDAAHYRSNMGSLMTLWDRIFGTYMDRGKIQRPLSFGIGERVAPARLVLGF